MIANRAPDVLNRRGGAMTRTVNCGVDFHARMQTVAYRDSANGEIQLAQLDHRKDDVRGFYSQFTGQMIVSLESRGYSSWFDGMLEERGRASLLRRSRNEANDGPCLFPGHFCACASFGSLSPALLSKQLSSRCYGFFRFIDKDIERQIGMAHIITKRRDR